MSITEQKNVWYHSECRKPLVNVRNVERLRTFGLKRSDSLPDITEDSEQPSTSTESVVRPKRLKLTPKSKVCIFSQCDFCKKNNSDNLHLVKSDNVGDKLLSIKNQTYEDHVRICVSDLYEVGDASAQEKYYHNHCYMYAQRTCTLPVKNQPKLIWAICDEELLNSIQNTLNDGNTLNMSEVYDAYVSIIKKYHGNIEVKTFWKQNLKKLINDNLPNVQFVKSKHKKPEQLVMKEKFTEAIEMLSKDSTIGLLKNVAKILRDEIVDPKYRNCFFKGSFNDFECPPIMQFFLTELLFGKHELKVTGKRNVEVNKTVEVASQFLIQNMHSDRQVMHKPKSDSTFKSFVQTPLSIGLPLAIHSKIREKNIVKNVSDIYIGSEYRKILNLEKRVEQGVLQRMEDSGGFCLPDFVKKNVNTWFAIDNIDLLEDTPTGQNTFHGTIIVINQREENGEPLNKPLIIPEKLSHSTVKLKVEYMPEPVIKSTPIRFEDYCFEKRENQDYINFTRIWALASYFTTKSTICNTETVMSTDIDAQLEIECEQYQTEKNSNESIQGEAAYAESKQLNKKQIMPTWAATKSLVLSQTPLSHLKTNSAVVAPLLKTSPTNYGTLYTALKLAQGISAEIVGPDRKTLISLDMDLYCRALRLQLSERNINWVLRPGGLHIVFAALHALGKTIDGSGLDICTIESGTYTYAALYGIYSGKAYKRGMEYYITTSLAIMMLIFENIDLESIQEWCAAFIDSLHNRSPDIEKNYSDI